MTVEREFIFIFAVSKRNLRFSANSARSANNSEQPVMLSSNNVSNYGEAFVWNEKVKKKQIPSKMCVSKDFSKIRI